MHRLKAVLKEVGLYQDNLFSPQRWDWTTEPVNLLDESQCKSVLRHNFRGTLESVESVEDSIQARVLGQLGMANAAGDAEQEEDEADLEQLPLNELRRLTAGKVRDLCRRRLIVVPVVVWDGETGEAEKSAIEYCGVLFNTYRAEYWWFEIFDMLRKLVLSAMLPFVLLPTARLNVGLVVSFFCLVVVFFTRPLIDASLDVLMIVSLITQTLTLLYGRLLVQVEYTEEDASSGARADMMIAEWTVYIINIAIFAIPIMHTVAQDTSSYVDEKSAGKYTSEKVPFQELPEGEVDPQDDQVGCRGVNTSGASNENMRGDLVFIPSIPAPLPTSAPSGDGAREAASEAASVTLQRQSTIEPLALSVAAANSSLSGALEEADRNLTLSSQETRQDLESSPQLGFPKQLQVPRGASLNPPSFSPRARERLYAAKIAEAKKKKIDPEGTGNGAGVGVERASELSPQDVERPGSRMYNLYKRLKAEEEEKTENLVAL